MMLFKRKQNMSLDEILTKEYNRHRFRWLRRFFYFLIFFFILGSGVILYGYQKYVKDIPSLDTVFKSANDVEKKLQQGSIQYLDSDGKVFYNVKSVSYQPISLNEVKKSQNVVHALIATEDRDFYKEHGVNWLRTVKAGLSTYFGHGVSGGSTITQQLIKLSYFSTSRKDQTIKRKVQEIVLARELDKKYSKLQILTWYLNRVNYGNNQQGIISAAHYYYDKKPEDLSQLEAATLVGIVNSPTMYNPYVYPKLMQERRNLVLRSMYAMGYIKKSQLTKWLILPVSATLVSMKVHQNKIQNDLDTRMKYDDFITSVDNQLKAYHLVNQNRDLKIKTSMNLNLQNYVDSVVSNASFADKQLQEGLVVFNNQTGEVAAMSGGRNKNSVGGYNRAIDLNRSSGSSVKPLLDYAPGFDVYDWRADDTVFDTPLDYPNTNVAVHDWDNQYQDSISLQQALVQSRNIPAVRALMKLGLTNGRNVLSALGFSNTNLVYPNAIGVNTNPLQMASAYSSLANNGIHVNPRLFTQVQNLNNGKSVDTKPVSNRVYAPQSAYRITKILQGVFSGNGTATRAHIPGSYQAGKTGTVGRSNHSNALTDGWMIGYNKSYTIAIWVGYDNPYSKQVLTDNTAYVAQDIYKKIMQRVSKISNNSNWSFPKELSYHDDFRSYQNRVNAKIPFYLTMEPTTFLGDPNGFVLDQIYSNYRQS